MGPEGLEPIMVASGMVSGRAAERSHLNPTREVERAGWNSRSPPLVTYFLPPQIAPPTRVHVFKYLSLGRMILIHIATLSTDNVPGVKLNSSSFNFHNLRGKILLPLL